MKKFIAFTVLFLLGVCAIMAVYAFLNKKNLAAPRITNSYSLNEKLKFVDAENKNIIAIGSSMTFNNLVSEEIVEIFDDTSYVNLGSWGLSAKNIAELTILFTNMYKPDKVICCGNVMDFNEQEFMVEYDTSTIKNYINSGASWIYYFLKFDAPYIIEKSKENKLNYRTDTLLSTLQFDEYGGAVLSDYPFQKIEKRWNDTLNFKAIPENYYAIFDSLSARLYSQNIQFIYLQSPLREGLVTPHYNEKLKIHKERLKTTLKKYNHIFVDATKRTWADSLFHDNTHMKRSAAKALTRFLKYKE